MSANLPFQVAMRWLAWSNFSSVVGRELAFIAEKIFVLKHRNSNLCWWVVVVIRPSRFDIVQQRQLWNIWTWFLNWFIIRIVILLLLVNSCFIILDWFQIKLVLIKEVLVHGVDVTLPLICRVDRMGCSFLETEVVIIPKLLSIVVEYILQLEICFSLGLFIFQKFIYCV